MQKTLSIACAALFLGLTSCSKSFDLDTPLFDKTTGTEYSSYAYMKTSDYTFTQVATLVQVAQNGASVTEFPQQECYVYLSEPATEDVTVTLSLDDSDASLTDYKKTLSSDPGYRIAPEGYAKLSTTSVTIPKGQIKSSTAVSVSPGDKYLSISQESAKKDYFVIPLKIAAIAGSSSVGVSQKYATYFIPVVKNYQNVAWYTRDPVGAMLTPSDLTYEVSSEQNVSGWVYKKEFLYDNDPYNEWYADQEDKEPWVSAVLSNGTKKFSYVLFRGSPVEMTKVSEIEVLITRDGVSWISQGVLPTSLLNSRTATVIRFVNPIEAKGVKIAGHNNTGSGYFTIAELNFFSAN